MIEEIVKPAITPHNVAVKTAIIGFMPTTTRAPYVQPPSVTQLSQGYFHNSRG